MTTRIHIDNQTGAQHAGLADRLKTISEKCAPEVEQVVGLALPEELTIRLFTPRAWRQRVQDYSRARVAEEIRTLALDPRAGKSAYRQVRMQGLSLRLAWVLLGPRTVTPDGVSEIWFAPESSRHAGVYHNDDELTLAFAHELIHPAQQHRSRDLLSTADTPFPGRRGWAGRAIWPFIEGHATWGGQRIVNKICGYSPDRAEVERKGCSGRFLLLHKLAGRTRAARYEEPLDFFTQAIEGTDEDPGLGLGGFNGVWSDIECFPAIEEMSQPRRWVERVRPKLAETGPDARLGDDR